MRTRSQSRNLNRQQQQAPPAFVEPFNLEEQPLKIQLLPYFVKLRKKPVVAKVSSSTSTPGISPDVTELKDMVKALLLDKKSQVPTPVKAVEESCVTCGGTGSLPSNTVTNPKEDLKGITTRSGVAYQGPTIPTSSSPKVVERETEVTKDTVPPTNNGSTKDVQPSVVQDQPHVPNSEPVVAPVSAPMPNLKPTIPYPSRRNDERRREKANDQIFL
ncbi:hypothetical protein Tco_0211278 [Tanacetum coccineum]